MIRSLSKVKQVILLFITICLASLVIGGSFIFNNFKRLLDATTLVRKATEQLVLIEKNTTKEVKLGLEAYETEESNILLQISENIEDISANHELIKNHPATGREVSEAVMRSEALIAQLLKIKEKIDRSGQLDNLDRAKLLQIAEDLVLEKTSLINTIQADYEHKMDKLLNAIYLSGIWIAAVIIMGLIFSVLPLFRVLQEEREASNMLNIQLADQLSRTEELKQQVDIEEQKYRVMSETSRDLISTHNRNFEFTFLSLAVEKLIGYTETELLGTDIRTMIHTDDVSTFENALNGIDESEVIQYRIRHKEGHHIWFETVWKSINEAAASFQLTSRDITKRIVAQQSISISEKRFKDIADNTPIGIFQANAEGELTFVNERWCRIIGCSMQSIIGKHWIKVFDAQNKSRLIKFWEDCVAGSAADYFNADLSFNLKKRYSKWIHLRISVEKDIDGEFNGIFGILADISERKEYEQKLKEDKEMAENLGKMKAAFLSTMSHEIRTPLNAVVGISHLLREEQPPEHQLKYLDTLLFSAQNLLGLVNDILDFNKMEAGKIDFITTDFNFLEMIKGVHFAFDFRAKEKGIDFLFSLDESIPAYIHGDAARIVQILNNLLSNAVKFTEKGSVSLSVELLSKDIENIVLLVKVNDTGIGIPKENIPYLFDVFSKATNHTTRKFGGTGLGLSISKRIIDYMGGEINVQSIPQQGTAFTVSLPLKRAVTSENEVKKESNTNNDSFEGLKGNVLIVEDNEINFFVAEKFLKKWGLVVAWAEGGYQALEMIKGKKYDIILMDLQMPEIDGYETTKLIRSIEDPYFQKLPVIALTASALMEVHEKLRASGMNDMVTKPFDPHNLYQKIAAYLDNTSQRESAADMLSNGREPGLKTPYFNKLDELAEGDRIFGIELMEMYVDTLINLKNSYQEAFDQQAEKELSFVLHKHKTGIELLKLEKLKEITNTGKLIIGSPNMAERHAHLQEFGTELDRIINELNEEMKVLKLS